MKNIALLKEKALANIELLFIYWKLEYRKVNEDEYDFINPTRQDTDFGACRFNVKKGLGADFTGYAFSQQDFQNIGVGFDKEDFVSSNNKYITFGFDIIGLCQRLFKCSSYLEAASRLNTELEELSKKTSLIEVSMKTVIERKKKQDEELLKKIRVAKKTWNLCIPIDGTVGQKYLNSRYIFLNEDEPNIRFHSKIYNSELKSVVPAILFKVSKSYNSELEAIHRIYVDPSGLGKAKVDNPKKALGNIRGLGIWFGTPSDTLCIVEGPENALSIRTLGYPYVVSTIDAANYPNMYLDETIKNIILMPDGDEAGHKAAEKAIKVYSQTHSNIKIIFPPKHNNNPKWDWNDELVNRGKNVG